MENTVHAMNEAKNTRISMQYTSESGSEYLDVIFPGRITEAQWSQLKNATNTAVMEGFIPAQVGLPAPYDERIAQFGVDESDHVSTRLQDEQKPASALWTSEVATEQRDIAVFVDECVTQKWDIGRETERCHQMRSVMPGTPGNDVKDPSAESPYRFDLIHADGSVIVQGQQPMIELTNNQALVALTEIPDAMYQATREVALLQFNNEGSFDIKRAESVEPNYSPDAVKMQLARGDAWLCLSVQDGAHAMQSLTQVASQLNQLLGISLIAMKLPWDLNLESRLYRAQNVSFSEKDVHTAERIAATISMVKALQAFETFDQKVFTGNHLLMPEQRVQAIMDMIREEPATAPLFSYGGAALRDAICALQKENPLLNSAVDLLRAADHLVNSAAQAIDSLQQHIARDEVVPETPKSITIDKASVKPR